MPAPTDTDLDILARRGGNDKVLEKKVLLAHLAVEEAARTGLMPDRSQILELANQYCLELGLRDEASILEWLADAGLSLEEFHSVIADFSAILAVQAHHQAQMSKRVERHRRLLAARQCLLMP